MARQITVRIIGDASSLTRAFSRSSRRAKEWNKDIGRVSRGAVVASVGFRGLGRSIAFASGAFLGGAGLAAGLKASVSGFSQFTDSMQQAVGLAGVAQKDIAGFSREVLALGPKVGKSPQELAKAFYFVASSGIAASKAMDVVSVSAKASAAGLGETQVVADAVTSAMNAYGPAVLSAQKATDVLIATVREGKGEADQFAGVIGNVAAIASQLGVSFNEVGAALAAQTRLGTDAETAATQLQRVFSSLVKVSPQQAKAFESVGLNADVLRKQLGKQGLLFVLEEVRQAFKGNLPALAKAFGDVRAVRGVLALVGNQAESVRGIFDRLSNSAGSLNKAFDAVSKDTAQKFRQFRASVQVLGISLGAIFAPLAGEAADALAKVANEVSSFLNRLQQAKGTKAKLNVVWEGARDAAEAARNQLSNALAAIDWNATGKAISSGLKKSLSAITAEIQSIDWAHVGGAVVKSIAAFLRGVDWPAVFKGIVRLWLSALVADVKLQVGILREAGTQIAKGIGEGLQAAGDFLRKEALRIVVKVTSAFSFLGRFDPFKGMRERLQSQLQAMEKDAHTSGKKIARALAQSTGTTSPSQSSKQQSSPATQSAADAWRSVGKAIQQRLAKDRATVAAGQKALADQAAKDSARRIAAAKAAHKADEERRTKIATIEKKIADLRAKQAEAAKKEAAALKSALADATDRAKGLLGPLFQPPSTNSTLSILLGGSKGRKIVSTTSPESLAKIAEANIARFRQQEADIATLIKRGAPRGLVASARSGELPADQLHALATASTKTLNRIFRDIRVADKLVAQAARMEVATPKVTLNARTVDFRGGHTGQLGTSGAIQGIVIHGGLHIHGVQNVKQLEAELERQRKKRSSQTRGRSGGKR